jgi:hypothetical protein
VKPTCPLDLGQKQNELYIEENQCYRNVSNG